MEVTEDDRRERSPDVEIEIGRPVEYSGNIPRRNEKEQGSNGLVGHFLGLGRIYYRLL